MCVGYIHGEAKLSLSMRCLRIQAGVFFICSRYFIPHDKTQCMSVFTCFAKQNIICTDLYQERNSFSVLSLEKVASPQGGTSYGKWPRSLVASSHSRAGLSRALCRQHLCHPCATPANGVGPFFRLGAFAPRGHFTVARMCP